MAKKKPVTPKTNAKSKTTRPSKSAADAPAKAKKSKTAKPEIRHVAAEIVDHDDELREARPPGSPTDDLPETEDPWTQPDGPAEDLPSDDESVLKEVAGEAGDSKKKSRLPATVSSRALTSKDPISVYLQEIRRYPVLTREQELEIAKRYFETKDPEAAQALVTANLRFVVKVAAEYSKFGARLIDLVQEGNMGLMHAVRDFNPYKGVRLITYAVWWIRGYIQEYLMKQYSLVKIGTTQNQKKLFYRLQREKDALDALGENPDIAMIGTKLGIPAAEVQEMAQRLRGRDVSLSQTIDDDSKSSLMDFQKSGDENPDELLSKHEELGLLRDRIEKLRPNLSERELILLEERLLADDPLTLQEIGERYGITREAVRQMEVRLLEKIRKSLIESAT